MPPCATAAVPGGDVSRERWVVCLNTNLSIDYGTEAGLLSDLRHLCVLGEAPLHSDRAPQRHLEGCRLLTPLCVLVPRSKTGVEEVQLQLQIQEE